MKPCRLARFGIGTLTCVLLLCVGCRKDEECPTDDPYVQVDGRDQFVGIYDVYDTNGVYQYQMTINKLNDEGKDSLFILNWGNRFDLGIRHEDGDYQDALNFGIYWGVYDHDSNRWALAKHWDPEFMSDRLINDTLRLCYSIDNIAFYVDDGVSYFSQVYYEYGVMH